MQIAQVLAGYSLGGADLLRRAMGKKKPEEMAKQKADVRRRARQATASTPKIADAGLRADGVLRRLRLQPVALGRVRLITYQTAYLKAHYPHEFMAGLMTCDADNIDNIVKFIAEARAMGLTVEPPDINESRSDFTVTPRDGAQRRQGDPVRARRGEGRRRRRGRGDPRGARDRRARSTSIFELCRRVDTQKCNRRVLEQLIKSGALDGLRRAAITARSCSRRSTARSSAAPPSSAIGGAARRRCSGCSRRRAADAGADGQPRQGETYPEIEEWSPKQLLAFEKEALGFYVSGHPLDRYRGDLTRYASATTSDFPTGSAAPASTRSAASSASTAR